MAQYPQAETHHWLAPISPEMLVSVSHNEPPTIAEVAPRVAAWTGHTVSDLVARPLSEAFDNILPGLSVVVEEVCTSGTPVRDYRMTFVDHAGVERAILLQASLRPARSGAEQRIVVLRLEEVPAPEAPLATGHKVRAFHGMVGRSPTLLKVFRKIEIYGPTDAPVLITGETGTGKELAARAIHAHSRRRQKPLIAVNCSALSKELLESELFGHERGAFTGAVSMHRGRFERAHGGTLFLDEIGELPLTAQAKLLRVLEEGQIERVGGERSLAVDIRLVAATNVPLELAIQARKFRLDLFHRVAVLRIHMPPLSEYPEDIPVLAEHFLHLFNQKYQRHVRGLTPEAITLLQDYFWPGNIRELRNVLERVYIETTADVIGRKAFEEWVQERTQVFPGDWNLEARQTSLAARPALLTPYRRETRTPRPLLPYFRNASAPIEVEPASVTYYESEVSDALPPLDAAPQRHPKALTQERIVQAYKGAAGNITQAARRLGVHKATLYRHMRALGITRANLEAAPGPAALGATADA
jgi:transcriptional regulator with GAF, ATPase, and Fis domain